MRTLVFGGCNFVCRMKGALYRDPYPLELVGTLFRMARIATMLIKGNRGSGRGTLE